MANVINLISLASIAYIDYKRYKIPNVLICGWMLTLTHLASQNGVTNMVSISKTLIASLLVTGLYFPLRQIVNCNAGDFKLFGGLAVSLGLSNALKVIFISLSFSVFPFASGMKKIPIGFLSFIGYVTFLVFSRKGLIWKEQ